MSRLTEQKNGEIYLKETGYKPCGDVCKSMGDYDRPCDLCPIDEAFKKLAHYEDLEEQLEKLYGGKMSLDEVVENLNRVIQNGEEKLDYARILTNAEAEKWGKWKDLEEQGRLIEVIRCKNCIRHSDEYIAGADGISWCDEHEHLTDDDDYCSYAVAKLAEMEGAE